MRTQLHRGITYTAFQTSMMIAMVMLPLAVMLRRSIGITLPFHRLIERTRQAYEADRTER